MAVNQNDGRDAAVPADRGGEARRGARDTDRSGLRDGLPTGRPPRRGRRPGGVLLQRGLPRRVRAGAGPLPAAGGRSRRDAPYALFLAIVLIAWSSGRPRGEGSFVYLVGAAMLLPLVGWVAWPRTARAG